MRLMLKTKTTAFVLMATAVFLTPSRGDQPQATAKIAEWAASDRGGRADYLELSHGRTIDIESVVCPGKITIVDLSSDYCAPCVQIAMYLIKISKAHPERYAIRRVNINRPGFSGIDLQSPVSRQFRLEGVPRLLVFDNKVKVADGDAALKWVTGDVARIELEPPGAAAQ
jgi:hypothetical protein